jgi:ubiquinone/menaquinone biosynthesis C-methylase UbiE/alpha-beta hydrolase superfamily lysophospholipase
MRTSHDPQICSSHTQPENFIFIRVTEDTAVADSEAEASTQDLMNRTPQEVPQAGNIQSTKITILNADGLTIIAYHDYPTDSDLSTLPIAVIAPGYGETKRDYLCLAYYFASNGYHVIRYDHTNHVGESDGDHYDISLTSMKENFQAVTRYVQTQWPMQPIVGIAASLASRVAMKAEAECPSVSLLISLMGIVDVQQSLAIVHQEDLFTGYRNGRFPESANVLGFNVSHVFLQDAFENNFSTLESTLRDVASLTTPVLLVSAGKDAWVDRQDIQTASQVLGSRLITHHVVPDALHRLQENPKAAKTTYQYVIQKCQEQLNTMSPHGPIKDPNRLLLGRQKREEKNRQQQQSATDVGVTFWQDYLGHFQSISTCPDYVKLLDHVFHALGPITPGQHVLDAGCGNGNAGLFFLHEWQAARNGQLHLGEEDIRYVGIDIVPDALGKAKAHMTQAIQELEQRQPTCTKKLQLSWAQVDLQHILPFADNQFDRIVSNLVLGYVDNPQAALEELYRVLAPGGRMVLSNLKPNGDFSGIYHDLVASVGQPEQREEARQLLHNYGKIRQAEKEGQFRFFDETEWNSILQSLGCHSAGVYPTFAHQAYLIVLEKPYTATNNSLEAMQKLLPVPKPDHRHWPVEHAA